MSTMRSVYTNLRAARTAIKDVGRLRQIAAVLVRHGLGHVVAAWNLQDKAIVGLLLEKRDPNIDPLTLFERITKALQELGPTFVKLGQILSTRPDLVPQALCDQFKTLQDNVSPISLDAARQVIEASLGCPIEDVFDEFSAVPLACASIAQVHTARLKTGEEIVLKVQRPGIKASITSDLNLLYFVARQIEATIPEAQAFDPVSIAREFERAITKELDFGFELTNLERFAANFAGWDTVKIPRAYREHSTSNLLVMERLFGHKITEAGAEGHDMEAIARETVRVVFTQVFEHGFFHGDLHPGNLFVLRDGRLGLIDFGLVGRMTQTMKDEMADLLLYVVTRNNEGVARCLYDISQHAGNVDYMAWEQDVCELFDKHFATASLNDIEFGAVLKDLIEGAIRHDVRIPPDYTMYFKALMTVEGIGKIVAPNLDLIAEIRPYAERLIAARYSPERVLKSTADTLRALGRVAKSLPLATNQLIAQIERGRFGVSIEDAHHFQLEDARAQRSNRALVLALAGTLLLMGTWMRNDVGITLFGAPILTTLCWALGGGLAFQVWWRIWRDGRS